jgi:mannosyltransferase OCH1-like enzyme
MIPKIIHRVHLGPPQEFAEKCWESSKIYNPDWEHVTHSSADEGGWEMVGKYLDMSPAFAYKSDLIRLELLYKYGGIYIDTDVEVIKSFNHFSEYNCPFAAWESQYVIGSAVIGAPKNSPDVLDLIAYCIGSIELESKDGKIEYGGHLRMFSPSVLTKLWKMNSEVVLLDPQYFYPYHWEEKHRSSEDFSGNPYTYAVHHWSGSWFN